MFIMALSIFFGLNYFGIKYTRQSKRKRLWAGIISILISPIIFLGSLGFTLLFDEGGFGAGFIAVLLTSGFVLNSIIIMFSAFFMPSKS
ncbi:hypothetical protein [Lysinibacillus contaminans]|uniref:hypothetical protein n=1 Tax=Lysinibacillus contaminans TaxID=1293441 RepID=UPI0012E248D8|nr:hypothetical protein [Lysinibacillus contaminans]